MNRIALAGLIVSFMLATNVTASKTIFVATDGDDLNPGTIENPKKTIQAAVYMLEAGDTLFLRGGLYHEEVVMNDLTGTSELPVVIMAYPGEKVIIDGTIDLEEIKVPGSVWELAIDSFPGTTKIYKLDLEEDIWQLFVSTPELMPVPNAVGGLLADYRMQVVARWPNGGTHPCDPLIRKPFSHDPEEDTWWSFPTTWAKGIADRTSFTVMECDPSQFDLGGTGRSFEGATAIVSVIKQGPANIAVGILEHEAGSNVFTHTGTDPGYEIYKGNNSPSFVIEHLYALDSPGEWYYDTINKTVFLWPEDNQDPAGHLVRGKTQTRAFTMDKCSHIQFIDLGLFSSTFIADGDYISYINCNISYPDMPKRVLGIYDDGGPAIDARGCKYFTMRNCVVEYSQYHILETDKEGSVFENNLFHHLGIMGMGRTGCFLGVNTFIRNTVTTTGNRATIKCNSTPVSGRIQSWNIFDGCGYLYANDGVCIQTNQASSPGSVRAYTWFIRNDKPGHRYDGPEEGKGFPTDGMSHHLVGYRTKSISTNIKGDYNQVYNYTDVFSTKEHGGIAIRWNLETGEGNKNTIMRNCAADDINKGKWWPLPCIQSNNWHANRLDAGRIYHMLEDPDHFDFRPLRNSPLVDAGYIVPGITDDYEGPAPDIGSYEWGDDTYWIPGYQPEKTSFPIPADGADSVSLDRDLIFLHGYLSQDAVLYFGTDMAAVAGADTSSAFAPGEGDPESGDVIYVVLSEGRNIVSPAMLLGNPNEFDPAPYSLVDDPWVSLKANQNFYWRVDAEKEDKPTIPGDVWTYATGDQSFNVKYKIYGDKRGTVTPAEGAWIEVNNKMLKTDSLGNIDNVRLGQGDIPYQVRKEGYSPLTRVISLKSDTTIIDTIEFTTYEVTLVLEDQYTGETIEGADVSLGELQAETDSSGSVQFQEIEYKQYLISASAFDYIPLQDLPIEIYSDTLLTIQIMRDYRQASVTILDRATGNPVNRAKITGNDEIIQTNSSGEVLVERLVKGNWVFTIEQSDYFLHTDSVTITVDTNLVVYLTRKGANIQFQVSDGTGPVAGVPIDINSWRSITNDDGLVYIFGWAARNEYGYSIDAEGYQPVSDTFFLEIDTTINVVLQQVTFLRDERIITDRIFPNPATDHIFIHFESGKAQVRLMNPDGKLLRTEVLDEGRNRFDLTGLEDGIYFLDAHNGHISRHWKFILQH